MVGLNSQLHISLQSDQLTKLRLESEEMEISVAELIRRKLADKPTAEEFIELRKLKEFFKKQK